MEKDLKKKCGDSSRQQVLDRRILIDKEAVRFNVTLRKDL